MFEITLRLFHVEVLAEAEVPEDVKDKVIDFVSHVQRLRPFAVYAFLGGFFEKLDPSTGDNFSQHLRRECEHAQESNLLSIRDEERLHAAKRTVRESIIEHTSLSSVQFDIGSIPGVEHPAVVRPRSEI